MASLQPKRRRVAAVALPHVLRIDQITVKIAAAGLVAGLGGFFALTQRKPEPCSICGGAGNWGCIICDGEGFMVDGRSRKKCAACVGRGKCICRECEGSGWNKRTNYVVSASSSRFSCVASVTHCHHSWIPYTFARVLTCYLINSRVHLCSLCRDDEARRACKIGAWSPRSMQKCDHNLSALRQRQNIYSPVKARIGRSKQIYAYRANGGCYSSATARWPETQKVQARSWHTHTSLFLSSCN